MIVACVSSYREGELLLSCVRSAARHVDATLVLEGPVSAAAGEPLPAPIETELKRLPAVTIRYGAWPSDAEKRTHALTWTKGRPRDPREPLWVLWLDGDELLLWGEYLRDMVARADVEETATGGMVLRLVQWGTGAVDLCYGKLVRADRVRRLLESSYELELESGMVVACPNVPICGPSGVPMSWRAGLSHEEAVAMLSRERPPLNGEPHLLHRPSFRDPARDVPRLSDVELLGGVEKLPRPEPAA